MVRIEGTPDLPFRHILPNGGVVNSTGKVLPYWRSATGRKIRLVKPRRLKRLFYVRYESKGTKRTLSECAEDAAHEALFAHLTPEQQRTYMRDRYISVLSASTGRHYVVQRNGSVYGGGPMSERGRHYCVVPERYNWAPLEDVILSKVLMIRYDERKFLSIAG